MFAFTRLIGCGVVAVSLIHLAVAYSRIPDRSRSFRWTDLVRSLRTWEKSRTQFVVEGLLGIAVGILVLIIR
jgi:hypothetical protein